MDHQVFSLAIIGLALAERFEVLGVLGVSVAHIGISFSEILEHFLRSRFSLLFFLDDDLKCNSLEYINVHYIGL